MKTGADAHSTSYHHLSGFELYGTLILLNKHTPYVTKLIGEREMDEDL